MKKGDRKKQEILKTAEDLFCRKGYEETSVQDILDLLDTSKGSFYHHYESKESLLEAMCVRRAELFARQAVQETEEIGDPIRRLNGLFSGMFPLRDERLSFLMMILPVFSTRQGRSIRIRYCEALSSAFHAPVTDALRACIADGSADVYDPILAADICMDTVNRLWCRLCDMLILSAERGEDTPDLSRVIHQYRLMTERMLSAPYGSLDLVSLQELTLLSTQIRTHWKP